MESVASKMESVASKMESVASKMESVSLTESLSIRLVISGAGLLIGNESNSD